MSASPTSTLLGGEGVGDGSGLNTAVAALSAVRLRLQGAIPEQSPCQPANTNPGSAVALRTTLVPSAKLALQVGPQLMPDGVLMTLPDPVMETVIRRVWGEAVNT